MSACRYAWAVMVVALVCGCARTVEVSYKLPPAVSGLGHLPNLQLASLEATPPQNGHLEAVFRRMQAQCAQEQGADPAAPPARVAARVWAEVIDDAQPRRLEGDPSGPPDRVVTSLVRVVTVRTEFAITAQDGRSGIVELRRRWKSMGDPRVRGPRGLQRGDDPANIPPPHVVIEELFGQCVRELCQMLAPVEMTVEVPRRPHWLAGPDSVNVRFNEVLELEQKAAAGHGDLDVVLDQYRRLLSRSSADEDIRQAVLRVEHALAVQAAARQSSGRTAE